MAWVTKVGETKDGRGRYKVGWWSPDGRQKYRTIVGRDAAYSFKADLESTIRAGTYVDPSAGRVRFGDYARKWLAGRQLTPKTRERYAQLLDAHVFPVVGRHPVNRVTPEDVEEVVARMTSSGLAPSTIRQALAVMSGVFRQAQRRGLVARSPVDDVDRPNPVRRRSPRFLSHDEVAALAAAIHPRYRTLVLLGAYGGLRWGELVGLRVGAVRLAERRVDITTAISEVRGRRVEGPPKWGSTGSVRIPAFVVAELSRHLKRYASADGLVFTAARGGPLWYGRFRQTYWNPAVREAGIDPAPRPHDLRHTAAALAIAAGAHPKAVQELMRHRSIRTTLDTYGHLFPTIHDDLSDRLDAAGRDANAPGRVSSPFPADASNVVELPARGDKHRR